MWRLHGILTPEQEQDGFEAFEDEDFIYIKRFGRVCLTYSSHGATKETIRKDIESIRKGSGPSQEAAKPREGAEEENAN